ncbi:hypothetical protein D3C81_739390 [compost metagenome]
MVQLHQVLQVHTCLLQTALIAVFTEHLQVAIAVLRVARIQRIDCAVTPFNVRLAALIVGAKQQGMLGRAGEELCLQHVIDDVRMQALVAAGIGAVEDVAVGIRPAGRIHLVHRDVRVLVAEVLPGGEHVVEAVLELVAERLLCAFVVVDPGFALKEVV